MWTPENLETPLVDLLRAYVLSQPSQQRGLLA
jgi:hypothetical protein